MTPSQRASFKVLSTISLACALIVATSLSILGCESKKGDGPADPQTYTLTLDGSISFGVDYQTGKMAPESRSPKVVISFSTKNTNEVLTVDGSRLGGGLIAGRFHAYLGGAEVEQGEFQCLYQRAKDNVLNRKTDTIKITDLRFIHVIE